MTIALQIEDVAIVRGGRIVLSGITLALDGGAVLALEGPNGSGKTSLLRAIAGLLPPACGRIAVHHNGAEVSDDDDRAALVGWLGHQDGIKAQLTVAEQARFWAELYGVHDADGALQRFGLAALADLRGIALSAGQKRRLALARLALSGRPLWLLDEPLAALDTAGKALVSAAVAAHAAAGGMVIAATHDALNLDCRRLVLGGS